MAKISYRFAKFSNIGYSFGRREIRGPSSAYRERISGHRSAATSGSMFPRRHLSRYGVSEGRYSRNGGKAKWPDDREGDLGVAGLENSDSGIGDSWAVCVTCEPILKRGLFLENALRRVRRCAC